MRHLAKFHIVKKETLGRTSDKGFCFYIYIHIDYYMKKKNVNELWYFIDNNFNAQSTRGSMEQIAIKNKL